MSKMNFKILEDAQNKQDEKQHQRVEVLAKRVIKKHLVEDNRGALQSIGDGVRQGEKRKFICEEKNEKEKQLRKSTKTFAPSPDIDECILQSEICTDIQSANKDEELYEERQICYSIVYKSDIWRYLRDLEKSFPRPLVNYMSKQPELSWQARSILVDWLASVIDAYALCSQTFHLSVDYVDRFLSTASVVRNKFQLVGVAALLLAGKMEEIYPIKVQECAYLTDDTFTTRQVTKMEQMLVKRLRFKMQPPTIDTFIKHFCCEHELDSKIMYFAMFISELVILEGDHYLNHLPSELAAASVALSRFTICQEPQWPKKFKEHCGYSIKHLSPVVKKQQQTFLNSPNKKLNAIQKKYQSEKYHQVSLMKPRNLILEDFKDEV